MKHAYERRFAHRPALVYAAYVHKRYVLLYKYVLVKANVARYLHIMRISCRFGTLKQNSSATYKGRKPFFFYNDFPKTQIETEL